ncbi:MAG: DUF2330 domain-containing protein [Gemmataceae bacterium]
MRTPLALLLPFLALLPGPPARGCAIVAPKGGRADVAGETVLIVWDAQAKVQHFVRAAEFVTGGTGSADFGFLVPTPTKPEVAAADPVFPGPLARITAPRVETRTRPAELGCAGSGRKATPVATPFAPVAGAVTVVEQKEIGGYDVAVLKATDADQLRAWLSKNGYVARPELQTWLGWYVANGWYVTAFKVGNRLSPAGTPQPRGAYFPAAFGAIRLSFPTDQPFYPYREPTDQFTSLTWYQRTLRVYFLADARYEPQLGRGPTLPANGVQTVWSGPASGPLLDQAVTAAGVPGAAGRTWTLTEFEQTTPRQGIDDLWFVRSPDQSTVERPPTYVYVAEMWPWYAAGAGLAVGGPLVLLLAAWLIRRLVRLLPGAPLD